MAVPGGTGLGWTGPYAACRMLGRKLRHHFPAFLLTVSLKPRLNTHLWGSLEPPSSNVHRSLPQALPACGRAGILGLPLPGRGTPLVFT